MLRTTLDLVWWVLSQMFCSFNTRKRARSGQATVEAAYLIPIMFLLVLLLVQPGIILYDIMVMRAAAYDGCRLLATRTDVLGDAEGACEDYVERRLSSIPDQAQFHLSDGGYGWEIQLEGDEQSDFVTVTIRNSVQLLPIVGAAGSFLGIADSDGVYSFEVTASMPTQPDWVLNSSSGRDPREWVGGSDDA